MTNTEAIQALEVMAKAVEWDYLIEWQVAIDMAIKALQANCETCRKYKTLNCAMDIWTDDVKLYRAKPDDYCSRWESKE